MTILFSAIGVIVVIGTGVDLMLYADRRERQRVGNR